MQKSPRHIAEERSTRKVVRPGDLTSRIGVLASMLFLLAEGSSRKVFRGPYYVVDVEVCYEYSPVDM
jgi:hypothetical protein